MNLTEFNSAYPTVNVTGLTEYDSPPLQWDLSVRVETPNEGVWYVYIRKSGWPFMPTFSGVGKTRKEPVNG